MQTNELRFDLNASLCPEGHVWAKSGRCSASPLLRTVMGVQSVFSPPVAARDLTMRFTLRAETKTLYDDGRFCGQHEGLLFCGGEWFPDRIHRRGSYHQRVDGELLSLAVVSDLVPLADRAGVLCVITITNRSDHEVSVDIVPQVEPGHPNTVSLDESNWDWPRAGESATQTQPGLWQNSTTSVRLVSESLSLTAMRAGESRTARVALLLNATCTSNELAVMERQCADDAQKRLDRFYASLPTIRSSVPHLQEYLQRAMMSGWVSMWENPDFVLSPFPATLGIQGAGTICYLWDTGGFMPMTMTMLMGDQSRRLIECFLNIDLTEYYAFTPSGQGAGVGYSYSYFSLMGLLWHHLCRRPNDVDLFAKVRDVLLTHEQHANHHGDLLDYGTQDNLLETSTQGYEHIVASPNAERAWCFDRLADLAEHFGQSGASLWRQHAHRIRQAIRDVLWNDTAGWFDCVYPDGRRETVYSIQVFNVLTSEVCDRAQRDRILQHLRDGAFLGRYGVSSMSRQDTIHYEVNDPDWSGGGAYSGTGPLLANLLWRNGESARAWDVLKRHFWMGQHLPYYPQEHHCDRPQVPQNKRANVIAGLTGIESILTGLFGISPQPDGSLWIDPQTSPDGCVEVTNYEFRGHRYDMLIDGSHCRVRMDGREIASKSVQRMQIVNATQ